MASLAVLCLLFTSLMIPQVRAAADRFKHWTPQFASIYEAVLRNNCSEVYSDFLNRRNPNSDWSKVGVTVPKSGPLGAYIGPVTSCILDVIPEAIKSDSASADVLLGLMPTVLAVAGSDLIDAALLSTRRPLLAFFLALGAPVVTPLRTFVYPEVQSKLVYRKGTLSGPSFSGFGRALVTTIEFAVAIGAIANIVHASWSLGVMTFVSSSNNQVWHPLFWTLLPGMIHLFGVASFRAGNRVDLSPSPRNENTILANTALGRWVKRQITPTANQSSVTVTSLDETHWFLGISWFTAILTIGHYIYGTMIFSSTLFISSRDALWMFLRYLLSTVCCRAVLMYELAGMRRAAREETVADTGFNEEDRK